MSNASSILGSASAFTASSLLSHPNLFLSFNSTPTPCHSFALYITTSTFASKPPSLPLLSSSSSACLLPSYTSCSLGGSSTMLAAYVCPVFIFQTMKTSCFRFACNVTASRHRLGVKTISIYHRLPQPKIIRSTSLHNRQASPHGFHQPKPDVSPTFCQQVV